MKATRMVGVLAALAMAVGCGGGGGGGGGSAPAPTPAPVVVTLDAVTISPGAPTVAWGGFATLSALGHYSDGTSSPVAVTWHSSNPAVATIDADGLAVGVAKGAATITATTAGGLVDQATLTVTEVDVVYGAHSTLGLVVYPVSGGEPETVPLAAAAGNSLPAWTMVAGLQPVAGGVYLLERVDAGGSRLHYADLATGLVSLKVSYPTYHWSLAKDSAGRIYSIANSATTSGEIWRYTPSTNSAGLFKDTGISLGWHLEIDSSDNVYAMGIMPSGGGAWITRVTPAGVQSTVVAAPTDQPIVFSGGFARRSDGSFVAGLGTMSGLLYTARDGNADGDCLDAGERNTAGTGLGELRGLLALPSGVLANDLDANGAVRGIWLLVDGNGDGDYLDASEKTIWSAEACDNGWTAGCLRTGTYAPLPAAPPTGGTGTGGSGTGGTGTGSTGGTSTGSASAD